MNVIDKVFERLGTFPTTEARIAITLVIWLGTAIWVWSGGNPDMEFLGAIIAMSGLDALTFAAKRQTTFKPQDVAEAMMIQNGHEVTVTTDNPELEDERG